MWPSKLTAKAQHSGLFSASTLVPLITALTSDAAAMSNLGMGLLWNV
jgi:hypothetical protein